MRAINHALTGALIGLTVSEPAIALPVALASHYVLDAVPHWDPVSNKLSPAVRQKWQRSKLFKQFLFADGALCFLLVLALFVTKPHHWLVACFCAFLAAAPDLISINYYIHVLRKKQWKAGLYNRFAKSIQWFERPIGLAVEICWFGACLLLLWQFFR